MWFLVVYHKIRVWRGPWAYKCSNCWWSLPCGFTFSSFCHLGSFRVTWVTPHTDYHSLPGLAWVQDTNSSPMLPKVWGLGFWCGINLLESSLCMSPWQCIHQGRTPFSCSEADALLLRWTLVKTAALSSSRSVLLNPQSGAHATDHGEVLVFYILFFSGVDTKQNPNQLNITQESIMSNECPWLLLPVGQTSPALSKWQLKFRLDTLPL